MPIDDDILTRLAEQEILKSAKRGAARAEIVGPSGWLPPKRIATNKRFLQNTVRGALVANDIKDKKDEQSKQRLKERLKYKQRHLTASTKRQSTSSPKNNEQNDTSKLKNNHSVRWRGETLEIKPHQEIETSQRKKKLVVSNQQKKHSC